MNRAASLLLVILVLAAAGCGATGGRPPVASAPSLEGQSALDAQATLAVWSAQGTAVAASTAQAVQATADAAAAIARATADAASAQATGTAVAHGATAEAGAVATGAAQATATTAAVQATATWGAIEAQAQVIAVQQTADAGAYALQATATADAAIQAFMQAEAAQTIAEREAEVARQEMWNRITPWLVGAAVAIGAVLTFLVVAGLVLVRVRQARPQRAGDVWVLHHPEGPRVIAQPATSQAPRVAPRALLPDATASRREPPALLAAPANGHMLIAGETGSGKSTAAQLVAAARRRVRVLDPHWNGTDWPGRTVIGAGRDFEAIARFMEEMRGLLDERYQARAGGQDDFEPLTVFVDEMPAIVAALGRDVRDFWREWLREGRKVGLYLVLLTQSTRVRTLGIEGEKDLLENFGAALVLGGLARAEYPHLVEGMERPAVLHTLGKARPVIVPNVVVTGATAAQPHDGGLGTAAEQGHAPHLFVAPLPQYAESSDPDPDNLTDDDRQRIVESYRRSRSLAAVQRELFPGYKGTGGRAWYAIKNVLVEEGVMFG